MLEKDTFVKVCGITNQKDADLCMEQDADLIGFIFHKESPRYVSPETVQNITTPGLMRTGVFTDHSVEEVRKIMTTAHLDLAQLHGDQDLAFCQAIGKNRVVKVLWPERYETREALEEDMRHFVPGTRFFLFDAGSAHGGHGIEQNWSFLSGTSGMKTWFVAGGIGPDNLKDVIIGCNPCGIDLNSGVEKAPGEKDPAKLEAVFTTLRQKML